MGDETAPLLCTVCPDADPDSELFPDWLPPGHLKVVRCTACERCRVYPRLRCAACGSPFSRIESVPFEGVVYSFSVVHRPPTQQEPPPQAAYVIGLCEVDDTEGMRLMVRLTGVEATALRIGARVQGYGALCSCGHTLPFCRPVAGAEPRPGG